MRCPLQDMVAEGWELKVKRSSVEDESRPRGVVGDVHGIDSRASFGVDETQDPIRLALSASSEHAGGWGKVVGKLLMGCGWVEPVHLAQVFSMSGWCIGVDECINVVLDEFRLLVRVSRGLPYRNTVIGRPEHSPLEGHQWI